MGPKSNGDSSNFNNGDRAAAAGLKDPKLLDVSDLIEVAQWILIAVTSGVIGNAAYDLLKSVKRRFGQPRLRELEDKVNREIDELAENPDVTKEEIRMRVRALFGRYE